METTNEQIPIIYKTAGMQELFGEMIESVKELWDPEHPIISILNFFTIGYLSRLRLIYGIVAGVLAASGYSLAELLAKIRALLSGIFASRGTDFLQDEKQVDEVSQSIASQVVPPEIREKTEIEFSHLAGQSMESLNANIYRELIKTAALNNELPQLTKAINNATAIKIAIGVPPVLAIINQCNAPKTLEKMAIGGGLLKLLFPFFKGSGFVGFIGMLIKTVLLGVGLSAVTGVGAKELNKAKKEHPEAGSADETLSAEEAAVAPKTSILNKLKYAGEKPPPKNDAPDGVFNKKEAEQDTFAWMEEPPLGHFEELMFRWIEELYPGSAVLLNSVDSKTLARAMLPTKENFAKVNKGNADQAVIRVPTIYPNKTKVVREILSKVNIPVS